MFKKKKQQNKILALLFLTVHNLQNNINYIINKIWIKCISLVLFIYKYVCERKYFLYNILLLVLDFICNFSRRSQSLSMTKDDRIHIVLLHCMIIFRHCRIPGFHLLSSSVTMSTPLKRFCQNSSKLFDSGRRPEIPAMTISSMLVWEFLWERNQSERNKRQLESPHPINNYKFVNLQFNISSNRVPTECSKASHLEECRLCLKPQIHSKSVHTTTSYKAEAGVGSLPSAWYKSRWMWRTKCPSVLLLSKTAPGFTEWQLNCKPAS